MDPILALAKKFSLRVIEDCAQSYLAEDKGRLVGTMGDIGCFSLQQSKQITTGDGGILITNNPEFSRRAGLFTDKAWPRVKLGDARGHLFLGMNYRMNELTGAVALAQLGKLKTIVLRRRETAHRLYDNLKTIKGIIPITILPESQSSWWIFSFYIDPKTLHVTPAEFAQALNAEGIPCNCGYIPMPLFEYPVIRDRKTFGSSGLPWTLPQSRQNIVYNRDNYPGTVKALSELIVISWCEGITKEDADDVCQAIKKLAKYYSS